MTEVTPTVKWYRKKKGILTMRMPFLKVSWMRVIRPSPLFNSGLNTAHRRGTGAAMPSKCARTRRSWFTTK